MKHQSDEADLGMGPDAVGQPMEHRRNLDLALKHMEAALDVSQALVAQHHLRGRQVGHVGHQEQFAVHQAGLRQSVLVDVPAQLLVLQVHFDDAAQPGALRIS